MDWKPFPIASMVDNRCQFILNCMYLIVLSCLDPLVRHAAVQNCDNANARVEADEVSHR